MGIQISMCQQCKEYYGIASIPCCDYFKENNKQKIIDAFSIKIQQESIILPNENNMNSLYESKVNQNSNKEDFKLSLSPISKGKKNTADYFRMNINESSNNKYNSSNIDTNNKIYETKKIKIDNIALKEESYVKEESISQEENKSNSNSYVNSQEKELIEKLIVDFDNKIKGFADYISEEKFNNSENPSDTEVEEKFDVFNKNTKKEKDCFERPPLLFKKDNSKYKGYWNKKGEKCGFGVFFDSEGNKYAGNWENDKFNGKGRLCSINGDYYEGDFSMGSIEGNGIYFSKKEKYKYIGQFKHNKFHGKGKIINENNELVYEGDYLEGYKHGFGKLIFEDKSYYEGNFFHNNLNGKGKFFFKSGKSYHGNWKNNTMDGKGIFIWENKDKYKGEYKNNMRDGNGVYSFGCNLYDGGWVSGMMHGEGTLLYEGLRIVGKFRFGKILEIIEGKCVNKELTEKYTMDSKINFKFEDTFKETIDSKISSINRNTISNKDIINKKIESKISFDKESKNKDKNKFNKNKSAYKDKKEKRNSKKFN